MKTIVDLPMGHLLVTPKVNIDLELTGEHHERLVTGNKALYERVMASVIDDLIDESVYKLSLIDLIYLFFMIKSQSIGPTYESDWICNKYANKTIDGQVKVAECGTQNTYTYNIVKEEPKFVDSKFKYPIRKMFVKEGDDVVELECYVKVLLLEDEFEIIDWFLNKGYNKEDLFTKCKYEYSLKRVLRSLTFVDDKYKVLNDDDKAKHLKSSYNKFSFINELINDLNYLNSFGFDLGDKVVRCKECAGVVRLQLPFSSEFFLSNGHTA